MISRRDNHSSNKKKRGRISFGSENKVFSVAASFIPSDVSSFSQHPQRIIALSKVRGDVNRGGAPEMLFLYRLVL